MRTFVAVAVVVSLGGFAWGLAAKNVAVLACSSLVLLWVAGQNRARIRRDAAAAQVHVSVDDEGIRCRDARRDQRVTWSNLIRITIFTTDEGPFADDLFWAFEDAHGGSCIVPGSAAGPLFDWLARIPGVDYEAIIEAQGSTDHARFRIWSGVPGAAVPSPAAPEPAPHPGP